MNSSTRTCGFCGNTGHNRKTCIRYNNEYRAVRGLPSEALDIMKHDPKNFSVARQMIDNLREIIVAKNEIAYSSSQNHESVMRNLLDLNHIYKSECEELKEKLQTNSRRQPMNDYIKKKMRDDLKLNASTYIIQDNVEIMKDTTECPICYDDVEHDKMEFQPCGHHFCNDCLVRTFDKCAICRE